MTNILELDLFLFKSCKKCFHEANSELSVAFRRKNKSIEHNGSVICLVEHIIIDKWPGHEVVLHIP